MSQKKSTKKGSTKGKAEGSRRRPSHEAMSDATARNLDALVETSDFEFITNMVVTTIGAVSAELGLDEPIEWFEQPNDGDRTKAVEALADWLRSVPATFSLKYGPERGPSSEEAHTYALMAYRAALSHYEDNQGDPFALSRLAVVYGEQEPGDFNMVVTLPGRMRASWVENKHLRSWERSGEMFARYLTHDKGSEAFSAAFVPVFDAGLREPSNINLHSPALLRVTLPLLMLDASGTNHVAEAEHTVKLLRLLADELSDDEVSEEVRASVGLQ